MGEMRARFVRNLARPRTLAVLVLVALVLWWPVTRLHYYWWVRECGGHPERNTDFTLISKVLPPAGATLEAVYRGLPHQRWEKNELFKELFTSENRAIGGYRFYSRQMRPAAEAEQRKLTEALQTPRLYMEYQPGKQCGGFHPDFCFEWKSQGGERFQLLLCAGCGEAIIIGGGDELHCDVDLGPGGMGLVDLLRGIPAR